jgi:hypothetical protein
MATPLRAALRQGLLPSALAAALAAGCASAGPRPYYGPKANVLPESDPGALGTVTMQAVPLAEVNQVAVRMGRDREGRLVVLQVLSPVLTLEQQQEIMRAFYLGGFKRQTVATPETDNWIENIVRNKQ